MISHSPHSARLYAGFAPSPARLPRGSGTKLNPQRAPGARARKFVPFRYTLPAPRVLPALWTGDSLARYLVAAL